jgi:N-acetylglutamate synthase-like GNAT family acetyltransferase
MASRKFAMIDNNGVVVAVVALRDDDAVRQGTIAGLLSDPECFEVSPYSKVNLGWKYINGTETETI